MTSIKCGAVRTLFFLIAMSIGRLASAQTVEMAVYTDAYVTVDEGSVVYADIYDATDLSQWGGLVFHYNYSSAASVSGSLGSDSSSGSIMSHAFGPFSDSENDVDGYLDIFVEFICTSAGYLNWSAPSQLVLPIRWYRYHYVWDSGFDGYVIPYWLGGAQNHCRATSVDVPAWGSSPPNNMTMHGRAYVLPSFGGPSFEFCSNKCESGHAGERVLSGSNAQGPIDCPVR